MDETILNVTYSSSLSDLKEVNSSFDSGVLRICYSGENKNGTYISKDVIEKSLPTIYNCPIVCNYDRDSDTLGGHDIEVVTDGGGDTKVVNMTIPVGVIPESARVWFGDFEEKDGTVKEYLYADALIWKRQEAYGKIKRDGIVSQSMEIKVKDGDRVDGLYNIKDFEFNAFALIGVEPCFEDAALDMTYSGSDYAARYSAMMRELKDCNYTEDDTPKKQEEVKCVEKYAENAAEDRNDSQYALTSNVIDELIRVLQTEKIQIEWGECPRYWYVDCDLDAGEVYCVDNADKDFMLYGFTFSMSGDSVIIDYQSKKRKKYTISDFEEGANADAPMPLVENIYKDAEAFTACEKSKTEVLLKDVKATLGVYEKELEELRQFKKDTEDAELERQRRDILAEFSDLDGTEKFERLKETAAEYSDTDELLKECYAIRGEMMAAALNYSKGGAPSKLKIVREISEEEPYGGIIAKYAK